MALNIPESVISPQDLTELIVSLRQYASELQKLSIRQRATNATGKTSLQPPENVALLLALQKITDTTDATKIKACIAELEHLHKSAPVITITLAAQPTMDIVQQLTRWCRTNIGKNVLVRFEHNRLLLGGMVVRFGSHIYDWSFRRALQNTTVSLPEVLRRV